MKYRVYLNYDIIAEFEDEDDAKFFLDYKRKTLKDDDSCYIATDISDIFEIDNFV